VEEGTRIGLSVSRYLVVLAGFKVSI